MKSYKEVLKDKRWDIRRKKAYKDANNVCSNCGCGDEKLNAHHNLYYEKPDGTFYNPWDKIYGENIIVLCESCHKDVHSTFDGEKVSMPIVKIIPIFKNGVQDSVKYISKFEKRG